MKLRSLLPKLALAGASLIICVAAFELGLRLAAPGENQNSGRLYTLEPNLDLKRSSLLPNAEAIHLGIPVRTNSFGLRDREYSVEKTPGIYRIGIFGDSFVYGQGVLREEIFPELLERRFGPRTEVINFGICGMNTFQEMMFYENFGQQFDPDMVLLVWLPFDHALQGYRFDDFAHFVETGTIERGEAQSEKPEQAGGLTAFYMNHVKSLYSVRVIGRRLKQLVSRAGININRIEENAIRNFDSEGYRLEFAAIKHMHAQVTRRGAEFYLVIFPGLQALDSDYYQEILYSKIEAFAAENGIETINLFPSFRGRRAFDLHVSLVDAHPNAAGHLIASDALFDALAAKLPRPPPATAN